MAWTWSAAAAMIPMAERWTSVSLSRRGTSRRWGTIVRGARATRLTWRRFTSMWEHSSPLTPSVTSMVRSTPRDTARTSTPRAPQQMFSSISTAWSTRGRPTVIWFSSRDSIRIGSLPHSIAITNRCGRRLRWTFCSRSMTSMDRSICTSTPSSPIGSGCRSRSCGEGGSISIATCGRTWISSTTSRDVRWTSSCSSTTVCCDRRRRWSGRSPPTASSEQVWRVAT